MQHTAFFGDGEKTFALTTDMILELERTTGSGIMALYGRFSRLDAHFHDLTEVIRTGLIGAGTSPENAHKLVSIYARSMLITDLYALAFDVLDARWSGKPEAPAIAQDELRQAAVISQISEEAVPTAVARFERASREAAVTGDLSAAINEALAEAGL